MRPRESAAVAGVLLAAGASTRMGLNKLFLELEGQSLLKRAAQRAVAAGLEPVIVILGHEAERARAEVAELPVTTVFNPNHASGINTSFKAGIAAVPREARAAVVLLADMPSVTEPMIARLVETYRESGAPLVVSDYAGVQAPPTLYDRSLFAEIDALEGEGCGKQVVRRHRGEAAAVAFPAAALNDVDRPEDWERMRTEHSEDPCVTTS